MNLLIASTSTVYGGKYLDYLTAEIQNLFSGIGEVLFIPYACPSGMSHDAYTEIVAKKFSESGIKIKGIHQFANPKDAIAQAKGIFTGGGNTFVLVKQLYDNDLLDVLSTRIKAGLPYMGTSAGSNIAGISMHNTNDMPIVQVPDYKTLGVLPFNINPHYLDPAPDLLKHMGETRDTRIKEYLHYNQTPVVALREGSWIEGKENQLFLRGKLSARVYFNLNDIREIEPGTDLSHLIHQK